MKKFTAFVICFLMIFSLSGCGLLDETVLVADEHELSASVNEISSLSSGKKEWVGNDAAVIDTSAYKNDKKISATSAFLIDVSNMKGIWGKSIYYKINPGEVTMLFSVYTALQIVEPEDVITVNSDALNYSTAGCAVLGIEAGDKLTVEQLLYSMVFCSDVDSANALAIGVSGSMDDFVSEMNAQAKKIGCVDTKLKNAAGYYSTGQYTTSYDLYLLVNQLLKDQRFVNMMEKTEYNLEYENAEGTSRQYQLAYDIKLISGGQSFESGLVPSGGITGSSSTSGYHLVLLSKDTSGDWIFSVLLGAGSESQMNKQMKRILNKIK